MGLSEEKINNIPEFIFDSNENFECSICLTNFKNDQIIRTLLPCVHNFHKGCIDKWLRLKGICPYCKIKIQT